MICGKCDSPAVGELSVQQKQRERLVALAAQVAVESDAVKFQVLLLKLSKMLNKTMAPRQGNGKQPADQPSVN
jgi:hypothetical protein